MTLKEIEETLKMPRNYLSGMLNGTRPFAPKWQTLLVAYVKAKTEGNTSIVIPISVKHKIKKKIEKNNEPANKKRILKEREGLTQATPETQYPLTDAEYFSIPAEKAAKTPPAGLTKAQQIRWHRENNQPLQ